MDGLTIGIVYSYEPESQLQRCVQALTSQTAAIQKIVGSVHFKLICTPKARGKDLSFFPGEIVHSTSENLARNRNLALQNCQTDGLYFTDPDCWAHENTMTRLLQHLQETLSNPQVYAIAGPNVMRSENPQLQNFFQWLGEMRWLNGGLSQIATTGKDRLDWHSPTCNILYFRPRLGNLQFANSFSQVGEDLEFHFRHSQRDRKIAICNSAFVWHEQPQSFRSYLKKVFQYGVAQSLLFRTHPSSWRNPRIWLLFSFLFLVAVLLLSPSVALMGLAVATAIFGAMLVMEIRKGQSDRPLQLVVSYLALVMTYGFGQLAGLFRPIRKSEA